MDNIYQQYKEKYDYETFKYGLNTAKVQFKTLSTDAYCDCCSRKLKQDTDKAMVFTSMRDGRTLEILCTKCLSLMCRIYKKDKEQHSNESQISSTTVK